MANNTIEIRQKRATAANPELPDLSWLASIVRLAKGQWNFAARLQCNVINVKDVLRRRSAGLCRRWTGQHGLVRVLWSRRAFMQ